MTRLAEVEQLFRFNRWATRRVLEAAATLPEEDFVRDLGSSFGSIRDTLVHMMSAEWVWLSRWNGVSPTGMPAEWRALGLAGLREEWASLDERLQTFVAELDESDLDRAVSYRNTAGEPFTSALGTMLRHLVNHASYHRGQVVTMLRQLGSAAPATDLILWDRTEAGAVPGDAGGD